MSSFILERTGDVLVEPKTDAILKPAFLSHGTLECRDFRKSRPFYEEFLGLECVQHGRRSMVIRCGMKFHVVCLQVGDTLRPLGQNNHWGIDMHSREEIDAAYRAGLEHRERYGIGQMTEPVDVRGVYSFYIEDLDSNWWEIQYYDGGFQDDDVFDFGDRFTPDGTPIDGD